MTMGKTAEKRVCLERLYRSFARMDVSGVRSARRAAGSLFLPKNVRLTGE